MSVAQSARKNPVGRFAADHPAVVKVARAGWFAKGLVYLVAGVLALLIAVKASGWSRSTSTSTHEASPTGALQTVAHLTGGSLLLWVLAAGMVLYSTWRVVAALMPGDGDSKTWIKRAGYIVSAVIYTTFAVTAISLALHSTAKANGNTKVTSLSDRIMAHTGGRLVIGAVGLIVMAAGLYRVAKGAKQDINTELDLSGISPSRLRWTKRTGILGEIGRGVGIGLVGFFLIRAATTYNQNEATGLDGALRRLATEPWGLWVVVLVGVGFVAYGAFCLSTFTHRRLEPA